MAAQPTIEEKAQMWDNYVQYIRNYAPTINASIHPHQWATKAHAILSTAISEARAFDDYGNGGEEEVPELMDPVDLQCPSA